MIDGPSSIPFWGSEIVFLRLELDERSLIIEEKILLRLSFFHLVKLMN